MQRLLILVLAAVLAQFAGGPAAASCSKEDFAKAVDRAGAALRKLNTESTPRVQAKMRQLKEARGWADAGFEQRAYEVLQDERIASFDAQANELLAKIDALGTVEPGAEADCAKLEDLAAASLELLATVKAKTAYTLSKLDQMLGPSPPAEAPSKPKTAAVPKTAPPAPAPKAAPKPAESSGWSAQTKGEPAREPPIAPPPAASGEVAIATPPLPPPQLMTPEDEGYTIDEILAASEGFFGKVSSNLAAVIEHLFRKSGRPTGYVLGTEGGGAFLAGVRYGTGTLYLRSGGTQKVFWHGPTIGTDVGAEGSKTLFLIYRMKEPEQLYASFTGIDGSAYFVGGVGATLVTNGKVIMAPIRSGVGLRLGANIGYIRFTPKATWNPF